MDLIKERMFKTLACRPTLFRVVLKETTHYLNNLFPIPSKVVLEGCQFTLFLLSLESFQDVLSDFLFIVWDFLKQIVVWLAKQLDSCFNLQENVVRCKNWELKQNFCQDAPNRPHIDLS